MATWVPPPPLYAGLGALATLVATAFAVALVPDVGHHGENMVLAGVVMVIGLGLAPLVASFRDPKALLRLEYLLPLALVYWLLLDLLQGDARLEQVQAESIQGALLALGLFGASAYGAAYAGRVRLPRVLRRSAVYQLDTRLHFSLCVLCFGLGIFKFAYAVGFDPIAMVYYAGVNRWSAPWAAGRGGGWHSFLDHLPYFGYLVPVLAVTLAMRIGWRRWPAIIALLMALILLALLAQGGGRRVVGFMAGAPIIAWVLAQRRLTVSRVAVVALACATVLYAMEVMLEYRNRGLAAYFSGGTFAVEFERINVDDNFLRLAQVVEIFPDKHDYVYHEMVAFTLVRPIPRALWAGKPTDPGFELSELVGVEGATLSASVVAEWFASGGYIAVILGGFIYGALARAASVLWRVTHIDSGRLLYGIMAMALFTGVRSMLELMLMSYVVLGWLTVWWFMVGRKEKLERPQPGAAVPTARHRPADRNGARYVRD